MLIYNRILFLKSNIYLINDLIKYKIKMFIYLNIIGRLSDGLILTENQVDKCKETDLISAKHKTKQFLKTFMDNK